MYPVSTSIHLRFDFEYKVPVTAQIERIAKCGFRHLDFNFLDWHGDPHSPFLGDGWESWIDSAGNAAAKNGADFNQAHAPVGTCGLGNNIPKLCELQLRAIKACGTLGVPWMVFHAIYQNGPEFFDVNVEHFRSLLDTCHKYNVGMAIENIWVVNQDCPIWRTEELIRLVDMIDDPLVGICWDTGHGNMTGNSHNWRARCLPELKKYGNQYNEITKLGKRLKALHIDDNNGMDDDHIAPFDGTINWDDVMRALRDIGYEHSFTFEAHNALRRVPESLVDDRIRYLHKLGETLAAWNDGFDKR